MKFRHAQFHAHNTWGWFMALGLPQQNLGEGRVSDIKPCWRGPAIQVEVSSLFCCVIRRVPRSYPKIWKSRIQTVRAMINNGVPGSVSIQSNLAKVGAMEPRRLVLVSILHVDSRSDWPQLWFPSPPLGKFNRIQLTFFPTHF